MPTPRRETRLHIDPPIDRWRVTPRHGRTRPVIATGHQPILWHPGILAKDIAAAAFAEHVGGEALHLVVDHDAVDPPTLDVPAEREGVLGVSRLRLGPAVSRYEALPANARPPIDARHASRVIRDAMEGAPFTDGLRRLADAYGLAGDAADLAGQTASVLRQLKRPYAGEIQHRRASTIVTPGFVDRLLADPAGCVRCYNRAALAYPEAGIRPLYAGRDAVEAPLWAQGRAQRTPVFIDLGDSRRPVLFTQGQDLDLTGDDVLRYLRPRALSLSALMRSEHCDLFIHGAGGGVYDRVTERWWGDWLGEDLAPMAVVSADAYLGFDAPIATAAERARAVWFRHHLPFNVDRVCPDDADAALRDEKLRLISHMDDDRDKRRRASAFRRLHQINAQLRGRHAEALAEAEQRADVAAAGVRNAAVARRRDWCFALYPDASLQELRRMISARLT